MTRNKEEDHGQDGEDTKYKDQTEKLPEIYSHRTTGLDRTSTGWGLADASRVGRPVPAGRPVAGTFPAALLLLRLLVHLPLLLVLAP